MRLKITKIQEGMCNFWALVRSGQGGEIGGTASGIATRDCSWL